jgi:D-sedoheptulose 7-phosphate isomerase
MLSFPSFRRGPLQEKQAVARLQRAALILDGRGFAGGAGFLHLPTVSIMGMRESREKRRLHMSDGEFRTELAGYYAGLSDAVSALPPEGIAEVGEALLACFRRGGTVFPIGNGGSAATASHFACDLTKGTHQQGFPRIRVMALTDNVPLITAWGNDRHYDCVFAEQLEALVRPGDLVLLISASGNSPNILAAAHVARERGAEIIAFTGRTGGKVQALVDTAIPVQSDSMEQVEDAHLILCHSLCVSLRNRLKEMATEGTQPATPVR